MGTGVRPRGSRFIVNVFAVLDAFVGATLTLIVPSCSVRFICQPTLDPLLPSLLHGVAISPKGGANENEVDDPQAEDARDDDTGDEDVKVGRKGFAWFADGASLPDEGHNADDIKYHGPAQ